jgi:hypothetical protein
MKKIFRGAWAVDYSLSELSTLFFSQYNISNDKDMTVLIVEHEAPHYIIAVSTGSVASIKVKSNDPTQACPDPDNAGPDCMAIRVTIDQLDGHPTDDLMKKAFRAQRDAGFPESDVISFKESAEFGASAYFSQGSLYESDNPNLKWHIIIVIPIHRSDSDTAIPGDPAFVILLTMGLLGFTVCFSLGGLICFFRKKEVFRCSDWRFTCTYVFLSGCLNLSTFTLLGETNNATCMLRIWTFNLCFVCSIAPLFVKEWRMHKLLLAGVRCTRVTMTHFHAFLYTLPMIAIEILILTLFSIVDPRMAVEETGAGNNSGEHQIVCDDVSMISGLTMDDGCKVLTSILLTYGDRPLLFSLSTENRCIFCGTDFLSCVSLYHRMPFGFQDAQPRQQIRRISTTMSSHVQQFTYLHGCVRHDYGD